MPPLAQRLSQHSARTRLGIHKQKVFRPSHVFTLQLPAIADFAAFALFCIVVLARGSLVIVLANDHACSGRGAFVQGLPLGAPRTFALRATHERDPLFRGSFIGGHNARFQACASLRDATISFEIPRPRRKMIPFEILSSRDSLLVFRGFCSSRRRPSFRKTALRRRSSFEVHVHDA